MHLLHSVAIRPNLELKTQPKQLLGYLQKDSVLPTESESAEYGFAWVWEANLVGLYDFAPKRAPKPKLPVSNSTKTFLCL